MAKDEDKKAEPLDEPKKSKLGLILGIVGGIVVLVGGVAGGIVLGPKLMGSPQAAQAEGAPTAVAELPPPEKVVSAKFDPIIVDLRGQRGEVHHLKVGMAAELRDTVTEDDFKLVAPRGREAALTYLRSLKYEDATNPKKYSRIRTKLSGKVLEAVGKERVHRILLVDFVAQ